MTWVRRNLLLLIAVLLVAGGLLGWTQAWQTRTTSSAENLALVDEAATRQVQTEVSRGLVEVLSYDYANPAAAEQAADTVLTGDARREYDTLVASLRERAPGQQLVLTATVQAAAVKELTDDTATLLVFLDQSSQRAEEPDASFSAAQLAVSAERVDGAWMVTQLTPL